MSFSDHELERYARHIMLDELDIAGQEQLRAAHVSIVGAGGLGCPAALYLAASGVGKIDLWDDDKVEMANLQRQILFSDADLGALKVESAALALKKTNPNIDVKAHDARVEEDNVEQALEGADLVLDASDNFATRYLLNRSCQAARINLVGGAAERFDGQIYVLNFATESAPCLNCLYPESKSSPQPTPCAVMGVFAPLTGVVGSMMASAGVGLLAQLSGLKREAHMLTYDAIRSRVNQIKLSKSNECSTCSDSKTD